jgi:YHS domain-containing protein
MNLAARNFLQDKTRLALSVAGVALAVMLILILTGFVSGIDLQLSRYLDHAPGSVVLVQTGSQGNGTMLPAALVGSVRETAGEMATDPVCGMEVERAKAVSGDWGGRTFYFCSRGCKAEFMVDPATFVGEPMPEASPSSKA